MRKGNNYGPERVIHAVAAHLGFQRVRGEVRQRIKSAINSAIRQGVLGYDNNMIWRE